ncbi:MULTISPECIES: hypothetical protein [Lysobacter]|uniref:Transmembrane protein n=1 Tax=Lysobacter gummosus TaxID=262324 RepID=A0ABY3XJZ9_9GAMM|nr:hypothetical protein [Lysobacter gummosus]ALN91620.1 putative transmembrane protein [Lysobacter gummosus]UNP31968.1 hypothetical protein MOV92_12240 [Lysobacter gummosus]
MILFLALTFVGIAVSAFCAFAIFWPLALVHLRDRHPALRGQLGEAAFVHPAAWNWLLRQRYRAAADRNLDGLATPARVSLLIVFASLACAGLLWLLSSVVS